jgi:hypothetical protein
MALGLLLRCWGLVPGGWGVLPGLLRLLVEVLPAALPPLVCQNLQRPDEEEIEKTAKETMEALNKRVTNKLAVQNPSTLPEQPGAPTYIKYTPSQQGASYASGGHHLAHTPACSVHVCLPHVHHAAAAACPDAQCCCHGSAAVSPDTGLPA